MIQNGTLNGGLISMPDWQEEGFVLSCRRHAENSVVVSVFTPLHGKHLGLIHSKNLPLNGGLYQIHWHARLAEHLGNFKMEAINLLSAKFLNDKKRLACLSCICSLLDGLLPEREPQKEFYVSLATFLNNLNAMDWQKRYIQLEALLLSTLGFGMDLTSCAGGGDKNNLGYVSPKTARAVSFEKGNPYKDLLLPLPRFLWQEAEASEQDLKDGLYLTGFFLSKQIKKLPIIRGQIL